MQHPMQDKKVLCNQKNGKNIFKTNSMWHIVINNPHHIQDHIPLNLPCLWTLGELFKDLIDGPIVVPNALGPVDCRILHVSLYLDSQGANSEKCFC